MDSSLIVNFGASVAKWREGGDSFMSNKMQTHEESSPTAKLLLWCLPFIVLPIFMKLLFSRTSFLGEKICTHIEITTASIQKQANDACGFFS